MRIRRRKSNRVKEELKKRIARSKEAFEELDAKGLERTWRDLNDVYVFF